MEGRKIGCSANRISGQTVYSCSNPGSGRYACAIMVSWCNP